MAKSAKAQLNTDKQSKIVVLEKDFAGIKAGQKMFVATPRLVDTMLREIPFGQSLSVAQFRDTLAKRHQCDATCPVSTAIFLRIAAQAALDEIDGGEAAENVTPFWRVLSAEDKISAKLSIDRQWLTHRRSLEQQTA